MTDRANPGDRPNLGGDDVDAARGAVRSLMAQARADLAELVSMETLADPVHERANECLRAAEWVRGAFIDAGIDDVELVGTSDGSTAVIGHRPAPPGSPTVLLYCHYDVQPAGEAASWRTDPFTLTESDGRWYGRGAADCKGNLVMHLTALRALSRADAAAGIRIVAEGSEETGTGGLEHLVRERPGLFAADLILIADSGNIAAGQPTLTTSLRGNANVDITVRTLRDEIHSGMFGGPAPDALAALIRILDSIRDVRGNTTIDGLESMGHWTGSGYPEARFRADAGILDGVEVLGSDEIADAVWARPTATVLGIDCPPAAGAAAAIRPSATARINLRVPPGTDPTEAQDALESHLRSRAPWGARVSVRRDAVGSPFLARTDGDLYAVLEAALRDAFEAPVRYSGQGGAIPLCNALSEEHPGAEVALFGVEEPLCAIHGPNESVDPGEIERCAVAEALLLSRLGR